MLHVNADEISAEQGEQLQDRVRAITGRPGLRVMVLARATSVEVISG